jgi:dihydroorotate dehydrogenase
MITPLADLTGLTYRQILKPMLFQLPADRVHVAFVNLGAQLSHVPGMPTLMSAVYAYADPILSQTIYSIEFANPVGLSAGFDYEAKLMNILPSVGFGWETIGTITQQSYAGNTPPMLDRLPLSQSLWVNKGFKNEGIKVVKTKLAQLAANPQMPVGISIGATNRDYSNEAEQRVEYIKAFQAIKSASYPAYYELNISCPNVKAKKTFQSVLPLRRLLKDVDQLKLKKPVFVKMPIDLPIPEFLKLVEEITKHHIQGVIIGNLTKDFTNPALFQSEVTRYQKGGFSGKPTQARSNDRIRAARQAFGSELTIIGTGGIFTADDAYAKIKRGASLVQLITGMVYQGPQVIGQINRDLAQLLRKDGFTHIQDAVGVE